MGDYRMKTRKGPRADEWKRTLVEESLQAAINFIPEEHPDQEFDEVEILDQQLAEMLVFDSDNEDIED